MPMLRVRPPKNVNSETVLGFHANVLARFEFGLGAINCCAYKLLLSTINTYRSSVKNSSTKSRGVVKFAVST
ncbi:unnamed protein product [Staurois parvus]|uniref:Uncharacterized protein n=1 Tax=Staurois parvus TaxID=386267 RepID=A0ABN9E9Y4_9NEOB|nr:unnamed protein product [Staurois parvus]